jgi:hypothetical protein
MKKSLSVTVSCLIVIGLAIVVVGLASVRAGTLAQQATVSVNMGINYGNGPVEWHNNTGVVSGESLLNVTMRVATVQLKTYAGLGAFVTDINGRSQNPAANLYWTYWVFNPQTQQYEPGQVGAGAYLLTLDQTVQWYYSSGTLGPNTSVSLDARLDASTAPPTAVISGSIHPTPTAPVNVTLEYSQNQGANYQEIVRIRSAPNGTFSYSWKLPGGGVFQIRGDAQGIKSAPVSVGVSSRVPGFPLESLLMGGVLGFLIGVLARKRRALAPGFGN